jgi:chromosomal replication initiation ATPase DnaA
VLKSKKDKLPQIDIVYIDIPWDGSEVDGDIKLSKQDPNNPVDPFPKKVSPKLFDESISDYVKSIKSKLAPSIIILKVPNNFDVEEFKSATSSDLGKLFVKNTGSFKYIFASTTPQPKENIDNESVTDSSDEEKPKKKSKVKKEEQTA